jgi:hypothetical protein
MQLHLFGVTDKRELWHSIGRGAGQYDELGNVDGQTGTVPAGRTIVDAACATDSEGNFHALVLADNGGLWYTVRSALAHPAHPAHQAGDWLGLQDLGKAQGPAANIGKINAVGAATDGMTLVVLAATADQKLYRAVRKPAGPDIFTGKWGKPFEQIKPDQGETAPPTAPFTVLVGAYSKTP